MSEPTLCLNTSTIRPQPLLDKIEIAAETGWRGIELWIDDIDQYRAAGGHLSDIKNAIRWHGLRVASVIALKGWETIVEEQDGAAWRECLRRMEVAAELGASWIIASPPQRPFSPDWLVGPYSMLCEQGKRLGVFPAMEFLGFVPSCYRVEHAWQVVRESGAEQAGIVLDPFHIHRGGGSVEDILPIPTKGIAVVHFNDVPAEPPWDRQTDADRVMPGDGVFNLSRFNQILRDKGYLGCISLELFHRGIWEQDPRRVAREGLEKTRRALQVR